MKKTAVRSFDPDVTKMLAITIVIFVIMVVLNGNFAKSSNLTSMCYICCLYWKFVRDTGSKDHEICDNEWFLRNKAILFCDFGDYCCTVRRLFLWCY